MNFGGEDITDIVSLITAFVIGGVIGAEREYHGKSAGFRTMIMICVGSAIFTIVSRRISHGADDRIAANIVNGIGFLGAGIIFKEESKVKGLTTAATVWAVAALGMCVGSHQFDIAGVGFALMICSLLFLTGLAKRIQSMNQIRDYKIVTDLDTTTLDRYEAFFDEFDLSASRSQQQRSGSELVGHWRVSGSAKNHEKCIERLLNDARIKEFTV